MLGDALARSEAAGHASGPVAGAHTREGIAARGRPQG
jgi:hypothetical protein